MKSDLLTGSDRMANRKRVCAWWIAVFGCVAACGVAVLCFAPYDRVRIRNVDVEECYIDTPMKVTMNVVNFSWRSVEIWGSADTCGPNGCVKGMFHRQTIPGWSSGAVLFEHKPSQLGKFRKKIVTYIDRAEQPTVTGWLSGFATSRD